MKKLIAIAALTALVACNTSTKEEVVNNIDSVSVDSTASVVDSITTVDTIK